MITWTELSLGKTARNLTESPKLTTLSLCRLRTLKQMRNISAAWTKRPDCADECWSFFFMQALVARYTQWMV